MKILFKITLVIALIMGISCTKKDDVVTTSKTDTTAIKKMVDSLIRANSNLPKYISDGFIKLTFEGESPKGMIINETINYTQFYDKYDDGVDSVSIYQNGIPVKGADIHVYRVFANVGYSEIHFGTYNGKININELDLYFSYTKLIKNNEVLYLNSGNYRLFTQDPLNDIVVDNFKFDATNGKVEGKLIINMVANEYLVNGSSIAHKLKVTCEFSSTVYRQVK